MRRVRHPTMLGRQRVIHLSGTLLPLPARRQSSVASQRGNGRRRAKRAWVPNRYVWQVAPWVRAGWGAPSDPFRVCLVLRAALHPRRLFVNATAPMDARPRTRTVHGVRCCRYFVALFLKAVLLEVWWGCTCAVNRRYAAWYPSMIRFCQPISWAATSINQLRIAFEV